MGVKNLNKFLQTRCDDTTRCISLSNFKDKTIVVDINVYLYRFKEENELLGKVYLMCSVFSKHNITPIFVFDGNSPHIKSAEKKRRSAAKKTAESKYIELNARAQLETNIILREHMDEELQILKKQFVRITKEDSESVKNMIRACGMTYIVADGESDDVCGYLCVTGQADACLSEDTDMFVYGCPCILKHISLTNETAWYYNYTDILSSLKLSDKLFKQLCILSGTDYNLYRKCSASTIFTYYKNMFYFEKSNIDDLFQYICDSESDLKKCEEIYTIYDVTASEHADKYAQYNEIPKQVTLCNKEQIRSLLTPENFYFV